MQEEDIDWEKYDIDGDTFLEPEDYEGLGKYHFLRNIFRTKRSKTLIDSEIQENDIKINGIDLIKSNKACRRCKAYQVQSVPFQVASADESIPVKNTCLNCNFIEIER